MAHSKSASEWAKSWWANMLLLGFDAQAESKRQACEISETVFQQRSSKALEAVLHFLLSKLDSDRALKATISALKRALTDGCHQEFRTCWPVFNDKSRLQEFRSKAFQMIHQLSPGSGFRKSTLDDFGDRSAQSACGINHSPLYRLYHPLCLLSIHALELAFEAEFPGLPVPVVKVEAKNVQHANILLHAAKVRRNRARRLG